MAKAPHVVKNVYGRVKKASKLLTGNRSADQNFFFYIDSPKKTNLDTNNINIEGWVVPRGNKKVTDIRILLGNKKHSLQYGIQRKDVGKIYSHIPFAINSGFSEEIEFEEDGLLTIEVKIDNEDYVKIYEENIYYSPEKLVEDLMNPDLARNYAEHLNLQENKHSYYYEEANSGTFNRNSKDPRAIAFYLPQFHPIPENNKAWGENFTEWTNVTSDTPRFVGHTQPFLPKDTGFYDLRFEQNMVSQIERAKKHGLYGFCFYYYWFSGKRLLDEPLNMFIENTDWDFNFTICWANENWTKRWDGRDNEVIVAQKYLPEDPLKFIKDVEHILIDPRYIREDNKPVLVVFRASELKDPAEYARVWRKYFKEKHDTELHLVSIISFENKDPRDYGFDMALDFAPQSSFFKNETFEGDKYPFIDVADKLIDKDFSGLVADYRKIALNSKTYDYFEYPTYKCVTPSWDNDARKKNKGFVMKNESPDIYAKWLDNILQIETVARPDPLIFINAWNEWAEGAVLEPTRHYGSAVLNRTTEVLAKYSNNKMMRDEYPLWRIKSTDKQKIAVVVHLYYPERWNDIKARLSTIKNTDYDLFVSLNIKNKSFESTVREFKKDSLVQIVPNRGRDILPFLILLPKLKAAGYQSVLKLHSKKSLHRNNGADWFDDMLEKLLPNERIVKEVKNTLNIEPTFIGPEGHFISLQKYMGGNERQLTELLSDSVGIKSANNIISNAQKEGYFAGSMFWASLSVFDSIEGLSLLPEDFEPEKGQIDGTLAHSIERQLSLVAATKYKCLVMNSNGLKNVKTTTPTTSYPFAE